MGTVANITNGPSNIFVAAYTGTFPAFTGSPTDFTGAGFVVPGFTQDGIEWDYTPTWKDLMVDEKLAPAKKIITAHKLIVSAKLAETTLQRQPNSKELTRQTKNLNVIPFLVSDRTPPPFDANPA